MNSPQSLNEAEARLKHALEQAVSRQWQKILAARTDFQMKRLEVRYFQLVAELAALQHVQKG